MSLESKERYIKVGSLQSKLPIKHTKHLMRSMIDDIRLSKTSTDWVEEQMAPLVQKMEPKKVRTYEDMLCDAQEEANELNWIHYLGTHLSISE